MPIFCYPSMCRFACVQHFQGSRRHSPQTTELTNSTIWDPLALFCSPDSPAAARYFLDVFLYRSRYCDGRWASWDIRGRRSRGCWHSRGQTKKGFRRWGLLLRYRIAGSRAEHTGKRVQVHRGSHGEDLLLLRGCVAGRIDFIATATGARSDVSRVVSGLRPWCVGVTSVPGFLFATK